MITLYDWLKRKKAMDKGHRMITLIYENSTIRHKKACIKSSKYGYRGYYMSTLTDEKELEFYTINYLLKNINEEFLREYYVTGGKTIHAPCSFSDDLAYELIVSEKISPQIIIDASQKSVFDKIREEIEQIEINGHIRDVECFSAGINTALKIIDKYTAGSMVSDYTTLKNKPQIVGVSLKNTEEMISRADILDAIGHGTTYTSDELQKIIKGLPTINLNTKRSSL